MSIKSGVDARVDTLPRHLQAAPEWRWYHGAIFYLLIQVLTFTLGGLVSSLRGEEIKSARDFFGNAEYFKQLHQSIVAPPSAAFGPVWTLNNIGSIYSLLRVLNKPEGTRGRQEFLALQGASWVNFMVFNAAYFSLRSPLNALALTLIMLVLTTLSELVAIFRLKDSFVALGLATLLLWLIIASTAAIFQAAWNRDDFYHKGPFLQPVPALEKQQVR
jgi:tryptophan-rich sensory protein